MLRKRRGSGRALDGVASACSKRPCAGELMFVAETGPGSLNVDCVLDFGEHGQVPAMVAVELPVNPSLASFECELIARWIREDRHIDATLTVGPAGSRLTLSSEGTDVILQVRTAESGAYRG